tara:strand:+ start:1206 stop:2072 length:867 start_codon:yes stop_codon:yes gene_type:complete
MKNKMDANKERMYQDVDFLTSLRPYRNYNNLDSLEQVCDYIKDEYDKLGWSSQEQTWEAEGKEYKNIITSYNKQKSKRLIIGAHYDVCGDQPGADDNASAVAGLLETARLFAANQPKLDYRVDFVAYCLEEPPFFGTEWMGSYVHAKSLHEQNIDVIGMICYEMIGYYCKRQPYPSPLMALKYPWKGNFIMVVGVQEHEEFNKKVYKLMSKGSKIKVQKISDPRVKELAGLSDQRNYWKFGFPALMINDTSFIRNPNYHLKTDTIDTLDFAKMKEVVNSTYRAVTHIV